MLYDAFAQLYEDGAHMDEDVNPLYANFVQKGSAL